MSEENSVSEEYDFQIDGLGEVWQVAVDGTVITMEVGHDGDDKSTSLLRGTTPDEWVTIVEIARPDCDTEGGQLAMAAMYVIANLLDTEEHWDNVNWYEYGEDDDEAEADATE